MQDLINEIRKLIEYTGENGTIKKEYIDLLCTKQIQAVVFNLTDYIAKKDSAKALEVLDNLLYNKEPIQMILITLYNHVTKMFITKIAIEENKNIALSLNLRPNQMFLTDKYKAQCRLFEKEELLKIMQDLIELDYKYKQGLIDIDIGLRTILCGIK